MHFARAIDRSAMFERYTEKARRTIFFARYEAAQVRSSFIETEHLLLGLIREEKKNVARFLQEGATEVVERELRALAPANPTSAESVDLPLSNESKRVLAYSAEEAERLHHGHIGTEHFFLGLVREKDTVAARILFKYGADLKTARARLAKAPVDTTSARATSQHAADTIVIHGEFLNIDYLESLARPLRRFAWVKQDYQPRDLLIEKNTGRVMFHLGQQFDSERFDLAKGAWPRDHCALCRWELNSTAPEHRAGYTNGMEWLCSECCERFVAPPLDPRDEFYT